MGNFDRMVAEYRAKHDVKHAAAVRAVRALAAKQGRGLPASSTQRSDDPSDGPTPARETRHETADGPKKERTNGS